MNDLTDLSTFNGALQPNTKVCHRAPVSAGYIVRNNSVDLDRVAVQPAAEGRQHRRGCRHGQGPQQGEGSFPFIIIVLHTAVLFQEIMVVVDSTLMSPYFQVGNCQLADGWQNFLKKKLFQRPLALGADVVVHSLTKYVNGHSDVLMGAVVTNSVAIDAELRASQLTVGAVPSPFDAYLVSRGLKTLHLRMAQHQKSGLAVAHFLEADPRVVKVRA
jgi:hypothetical protein